MTTPGTTTRPAPPLSPHLLGMFGQASIPRALASGLRWQGELDRAATAALETRKLLAEKLLAVYDYLTAMEALVERDAGDRALLYRDPLMLLAATPVGRTRVIETVDGRGIPVSLEQPAEAELPAWAPSSFPDGMTREERSRYPARPRALAELPPFDSPQRIEAWMRLRAAQPAPPPPRATAGRRAPRPPAPVPFVAATPVAPATVDKGVSDGALGRIRARFDDRRAPPKPFAQTPLVDEVIATLTTHTVADLSAATGVVLRSPYEDDPLIEHTKVILYHSVFTVVLDHTGAPFDLRRVGFSAGPLPYAMLLPAPGMSMRRVLPPPGGVNVSVQRQGNAQFRFENSTITRMLQGGVGQLQRFGYGDTSKHPLQVVVEEYLQYGRSHVASVSAEAAVNPAGLSLVRIEQRLADLAEAVVPYLRAEMISRVKNVATNWQEYAKSVGEQAIKEVVVSTVRSVATEYLIKKIGARLIPVVNIASTLYGAITDEDTVRIRHAIGCALLAVKGRTDEDITIAARVLAKVVGDEFEDRFISALVNHAAKASRIALVIKKGARSAAKSASVAPPGPSTLGSAASGAAGASAAGAGGTSAPGPPGGPGVAGAPGGTSAPGAPGGPGVAGGGVGTAGTGVTGPSEGAVLGLRPQDVAAANAEHQRFLTRQLAEGLQRSRLSPGSDDADPARSRHTDGRETDGHETDRRGTDRPGRTPVPGHETISRARATRVAVTPDIDPERDQQMRKVLAQDLARLRAQTEQGRRHQDPQAAPWPGDPDYQQPRWADPALAAKPKSQTEQARHAAQHPNKPLTAKAVAGYSGTVGVTRSTIDGVSTPREGGSPRALHSPDPHSRIQTPPNLAPVRQARDHAELVLTQQVDADLLRVTSDRPDKADGGTVYFHIDQPVCGTCRAGMVNPNVSRNALTQLSEFWPGVNFVITADGTDEVIRLFGGRRIDDEGRPKPHRARSRRKASSAPTNPGRAP